MNNKRLVIQVIILFSSSILLWNCASKKSEEEEKQQIEAESNTVVKLDNKLFSIPSPLQTAYLLKQAGSNYNKALINSPANLNNYSTNFKKALNLGIYGADLGYVSIYDQNQEAVIYLNTSRKLAEDLGVGNAFSPELIKRFQTQLNNKDSLMRMISDSFKAGNNYMQNNDRKDVSSLVVAGGFIESLYLTVNIAEQSQNQEILNRIGEQKNALDNLINLLSPFVEKPEYTEFIDQLVQLAYDFDAIETKYTYESASTNESAKLTTINSKTEVVITKEQLKSISEKVKNLRTQITG